MTARIKQMRGVRAFYSSAKRMQEKSLRKICILKNGMYRALVSTCCQPIDSGSNNFPSPVCAAAFASRNHAGGAHFEMNKEEKKACAAAYYRANREKIMARTAAYRLANLDREKSNNAAWRLANQGKFNARCAAWRAENPQRVKANSAAYLAENSAKINAARRAWSIANYEKMKADRAKNSDKLKARRRAWKVANHEKIRAQDMCRRARKRHAVIGNTKLITQWERGWKRLNRVACYWCQRRFFPRECHTDHIVALAIGGAHEVGNLCIACQTCNQRKQAKSITEWNRSLAQPVLL